MPRSFRRAGSCDVRIAFAADFARIEKRGRRPEDKIRRAFDVAPRNEHPRPTARRVKSVVVAQNPAVVEGAFVGFEGERDGLPDCSGSVFDAQIFCSEAVALHEQRRGEKGAVSPALDFFKMVVPRNNGCARVVAEQRNSGVPSVDFYFFSINARSNLEGDPAVWKRFAVVNCGLDALKIAAAVGGDGESGGVVLGSGDF